MDDRFVERTMKIQRKLKKWLIALNELQRDMEVEDLAMDLHEAGRAAVEAGNTVAAEKFGEQTRKFLEWDEITEPAKDGRRIQAKYLLARYDITPLPNR